MDKQQQQKLTVCGTLNLTGQRPADNVETLTVIGGEATNSVDVCYLT